LAKGKKVETRWQEKNDSLRERVSGGERHGGEGCFQRYRGQREMRD